MRTALLIVSLALLAALPTPDDGATAIAAGGLVARRETGVTMAKEVLFISTGKVVVDYDFRNDTAQDITTEVAFPVPPYSWSPDEFDPNEQGFDSFKLDVDGQAKTYQTDLRASVKGRDVTPVLQAAHIDIASFGHASNELNPATGKPMPQDLDKVPAAGRQALFASGAYLKDGDAAEPNYTLRKQYHWTQTFPAHKLVHIRHEYKPVVGAQLFSAEDFKVTKPASGGSGTYIRDLMTSACVTPGGVASLRSPNGTDAMEWVDFILTTANTWKRPIEDFTLIVERPRPEQTVSFCWDGPVEKIDVNHFRAHTANLIPKKELHIAFYSRQPQQR